MALGIHEGVTRDYRETEREMWNQYWWLKGIGDLGGRLPLKEFVTIRKPTREEVHQFQSNWKWEMVHANDWDPYVPVKVNKDGETVSLSNASRSRSQDSTQDQAIARALSTVGPPSVAMGRFQDRSATAPLALLQNQSWNPWRTLKKTNDP